MAIGSVFLAAFVGGWAVRMRVDSSRTLAVKVLATLMDVAARSERAIALEREHLEDLLAEARAKAR
jgi:hypothetical protein